VVGMVSCLKPQKSPLDFIRVAHQVRQEAPGVKFILAGDGILRKRVLKLIKRLHLEDTVILAGWRRDIPRVLTCLDIFVLTSLWEGLPIAALEAISASLPVVATDTGGIAEVVSDGETGFLTKPGDILSFSQKLSVLLRDENLRKQMGIRAGSKLGSDFTHSYAAKETQDIYLGLS